MPDSSEFFISLSAPALDGISAQGYLSPIDPLHFTRDNTKKVRFRVQQNGKDIDLTGATFQTAVGNPDLNPTAGTFTLTYGAATTSSLQYNVSAAALQSAINALSGFPAGGVTVQSVGGLYVITFNNNGARSLFTANTSLLEPPSGARIVRYQTGDGSTKEIQLITLSQSLLSYSSDYIVHSGGTATSTQDFAGNSGAPARYTWTFDPEPLGGTLVANQSTTQVTLLTVLAATGADADGKYFILYDAYGITGFYYSDGTTTTTPAGLSALGPYRVFQISILMGDTPSDIASATNGTIDALPEWDCTPSSATVTITDAVAGSRGDPSSSDAAAVTLTVTTTGSVISLPVPIAYTATQIQALFNNAFRVSMNADTHAITLIASENGAQSNFTLDDTNVQYPQYFEGTMPFDRLSLEWALEDIDESQQYITAIFEGVLTRDGETPDTIIQYAAWCYRNLIRSGVTYNPFTPSVNAIPTGHQIWVDSVVGSDGTGLPYRFDRPFLTIQAAYAAAAADDAVMVRPGMYSGSTLSLRDGVSIVGTSLNSVSLAFDIGDGGGGVDLVEICNIKLPSNNISLGNGSTVKLENVLADVINSDSSSTVTACQCSCTSANLLGMNTSNELHVTGGDLSLGSGPNIFRFCTVAGEIGAVSPVNITAMGCWAQSVDANVTDTNSGITIAAGVA